MRTLAKSFVVLCALGLAFAVGQTLLSAASTEDVLAKITKNVGEVKTWEADTKMTMSQGGDKMSGTGHVAIQAIIKDGKYAGHLVNMKQSMKSEEMDMNQLMVNDGEFIWMEMKTSAMPMVMVMKMKASGPEKSPTGDMRQFLDDYDWKVTGEETFDGQKMWILEGTPKPGKAMTAGGGPGKGGQELAKVKLDIGQKDLFMHRWIGYDKAGAEMMTMEYTNLKINEKIDAALFKYTPPPGAHVMDMTQGIPRMGQ